MDQWDPSDVVFSGHLRSFSSATGYGFVHNKELQEKFGRPSAQGDVGESYTALLLRGVFSGRWS